MKKLVLLALLCLIALPALAQEATIASPIAPPTPVKYVVKGFTVGRDCLCANVTLERKSAANAVIDEVRIDIGSVDAAGQPTVTELAAFLTAIGSVRASETGAISRKMNFRVLGHLVDTGLLTGVSAVP